MKKTPDLIFTTDNQQIKNNEHLCLLKVSLSVLFRDIRFIYLSDVLYYHPTIPSNNPTHHQMNPRTF